MEATGQMSLAARMLKGMACGDISHPQSQLGLDDTGCLSS